MDLEHALTMPRECDAYLDLQTGEVLWRSDYGDDLFDLDGKFEEDPDRYEPIPRRESHDQYREMEQYAESVDEGDVRDLLNVALDGRGAFGRFRNVLSQYPDLRARWNQMEDDGDRQHLEEWLDTIGIEPDWQEPPKVEAAPAKAPAPAKKRKQHTVVVSLVELLALGGEPNAEDGSVVKRIRVKNDRQTFKSLARELCETHGIGWRKRFIEDRSEIEIEGINLRHEKGLVTLSVPVRDEVVRLFQTSHGGAE